VWGALLALPTGFAEQSIGRKSGLRICKWHVLLICKVKNLTFRGS